MEYLLDELSIDLHEALKKEPLIARELEVRMGEDPAFLVWWEQNTEPCNDILMEALEKSTQANDYKEYDNIDLAIISGWTIKRKGTGKSSAGVGLKLIYDESITENGFNYDEIFFVLSHKLDYIRENAGKLHSRMLTLDEMVPLVGQSSNADVTRMQRLDDTTRINGMNNIYISPGYQPWFLADMILQTVFKDPVNNAIVCKLTTSNDDALGWVAFPRPPWTVWEKYQDKKREFLKKLDTGEIRQMQFQGMYDKLQEKFNIEAMYEKELEYSEDFAEWLDTGCKGPKPLKPKIALTPKRIKTWIFGIQPETTGTEGDVISEEIYFMLAKKFSGVKKEDVGGE